MNDSPHPSSDQTDGVDDQLTLITLFCAFAGGIVALALTGWGKVVEALIEHDVIVSGRQRPWVEIPYSSGAGLDGPRLLALSAGLLLFMVVLIDLGRRRRARNAREAWG